MKTLHDGTEVQDDVPTKLVNGKKHLLNAADLDQYQQIATRYHNKKPLRDWHQLMVKSDHIMTRSVEDLITHIGAENLPDPLQEKYAEKLALRAQKPESQTE